MNRISYSIYKYLFDNPGVPLLLLVECVVCRAVLVPITKAFMMCPECIHKDMRC